MSTHHTYRPTAPGLEVSRLGVPVGVPSTVSKRVLYRVCWMAVVGNAGGRGTPLPRHVAEFVVHDEALAHPLRTYWLEECAPGCDAPSLAELSEELKRSLI